MRKLFLFVVVLSLIISCGEKRKVNESTSTQSLAISGIASDDNITIKEGNQFFVRGDYNTAIDYYRDAIQLNKATAYYNIGVSYYLLGNISEAEKNFRIAVDSDPSFDEAVMNLVAVLAEQGKINEAERYISKLVHTNKTPRVLVDMANISLNLGDASKAAYYYKLALEEDKTSEFVLSNYANYLISIGEYLDGINILEKLKDKNFAVSFNIANAYYKLNNPLAAYTYASEALSASGATEEGYDRLAYLFYDLKRYSDESKTLRILINKNPNREYKIRLITSYINQSAYSKALDEIKDLLKLYPADITLNMVYYETLILDAKILDAGRFIREAYKQLGGDTVLYYYTKHLAMFERVSTEVKDRIFVNRDNGWLNLARTVYSLSTRDYVNAKRYLSKTTDVIGHDYYTYKTFLDILDKNFAEADKNVQKMLPTGPDTFWYKLVIAWNLKEPVKILEVTNQFRNNDIVLLRKPVFTYTLIPQIDDMSYTFRFLDRGVDIASMLAYPIFINPDDLVQYLVMGRSTLKDSDKDTVVNRLEGTKRNTEGIDYFNAYNFTNALSKFLEASALLPNNPVVSYNIGLTYFNIGDNTNASIYFNKALEQEKDNLYGTFGLGLLNQRLDNTVASTQYFDYAKKLAEGVYHSDKGDKLNSVRILYLSLLALNRFGKLDEARSIAKSNDGLISAIEKFMVFTDKYQKETLDMIKPSPVFRVDEVKKLLSMRFMQTNALKLERTPDKYYNLASRYLLMSRGVKDLETFNEPYREDKVYLKDMVFYSIYNNDKAEGLKYLQNLTNRDFRYPELYKASLYYFIWLKDFVNAEASVGSLSRMGYADKLADFYVMLYYLINYNQNRLILVLDDYNKKYTSDYRAGIITALLDLNLRDLNAFYTIMDQMIKENPYILNKLFVEVNFAKF